MNAVGYYFHSDLQTREKEKKLPLTEDVFSYLAVNTCENKRENYPEQCTLVFLLAGRCKKIFKIFYEFQLLKKKTV